MCNQCKNNYEESINSMYMVISDLKEQNVYMTEKIQELESIIANTSDKIIAYDEYFDKISKSYETNRKYIESFIFKNKEKISQNLNLNSNKIQILHEVDKISQNEDEESSNLTNQKVDKKHILDMEILKTKLNTYNFIDIFDNLKKVNLALDVSF